MSFGGWREERLGEIDIIRPAEVPPGAIVAFSGRGHAPDGEPAPTPFLARRLAAALDLDGVAIHWPTQVHGAEAISIREEAAHGSAPNAGPCDVLVTDRYGAALVVQSADCVPILLCAPGAIGAAHAGWKGSAKDVAGAAVAAMRDSGAEPEQLRAWLGPSIGPCCYEVGGEVAAQFAGDFMRASCEGGFRLDLRAVNVAQLEAAGIPRESISVHPDCTRCGGEKYASYRRDGGKAGRMIALIARLGA